MSVDAYFAHFGARMRLSLCLAGKSTGDFSSEFAWRRVTIFAICFDTTALLLYAKAGCFAAKGSYAWLILSMVSALYFALFSNGFSKFQSYFCVVVTAYWMAAACNPVWNLPSVALLCQIW